MTIDRTTAPLAKSSDLPDLFVLSAIRIIVPCLNEAELLPTTLRRLKESCAAVNSRRTEIVVVDGGSDDGSVDIAKELGCEVVISKKRQRAHQLNLGARSAGDDVELLWFVHADTLVHRTAVERLSAAIRNPHVLGGGFCRRFDSTSRYLRWTSWVADLRGYFWRFFYGDQAIFVRRDVFAGLGGFDETLDIAEDLDLSLRLREMGKTKMLRPPVIGSARRFEKHGPRKQVRHDRAFVKAWMTERGWHDWRRRREVR